MIFFSIGSSSFFLLNSQGNFCDTQSSGGSGNNTCIGGTFTGTYYLELQVNVLDNGNGQPIIPEADIMQAISILQNDFAPHNIFFVWDCNPILHTTYDSYDETTGKPDHGFMTNNGVTDEAIEMYILPDLTGTNVTGTSRADVNQAAFYVYSNNDYDPSVPQYATFINSHEMGHCLGLIHPHEFCSQQYATPTTYECENLGDQVCDTPADPGIGGFVEINNGQCEWNGGYGCNSLPDPIEDYEQLKSNYAANPTEQNAIAIGHIRLHGGSPPYV